jgi:IQ calmodulin-binding motif
MDRLRNKVKKGGDRMVNVLSEEFQNADIPYGGNGQLPISNFQTIMIDYDLPLMEYDLKEMKSKGFIHLDKHGNEFVRYRDLLESVKPKHQMANDLAFINRKVAKLQAVWRGHMQRKRYLKQMEGDLRLVGKSFNRVSAKGVQFRDEEVDPKAASKGKAPNQMNAEERKAEAEKKKK